MFNNNPQRKRSVVVDTIPKLKFLVQHLMKVEEFALDTETNSLMANGPNNKFLCVGISISWGEYHNYYIPLNHRRREDLRRNIPLDILQDLIKPVLAREDLRLIGANFKYDMHVLKRLGIDVATEDIFDVNIASWLIDENSLNGLKFNSGRYLNVAQEKFKEVTASVPAEVKKEFGYKSVNKVTFDLVTIDDGAPYALDDAFFTWELYRGFQYLLEEEEMESIYHKIQKPFIKILFDMEERGVSIDLSRLSEMRSVIKKDIADLEYKIIELAGVEFNPGSSQQLSMLLFGTEPKETKTKKKQSDIYMREKILKNSFRFQVVNKTPSGVPSTNNDSIWKLSKLVFKDARKKEGVELCKLLLTYAKLQKLNTAFIEGLSSKLYDDNKIHCNFNLASTDSGRLSCSGPNCQQLPRPEEDTTYSIRSLFVSDPGTKLIALDYQNLEMRILAHYSKDKNLMEMFKNGYDTHGATAVDMFGLDCEPNECKKKYPDLRQVGKSLNFGLGYGMGAPGLYSTLKDDHFSPLDLGSPEMLEKYKAKNGIEVAQVYIDKYFETYSGVAKFIKDQKKFAHRNEYVSTLIRRKRRLDKINSYDRKISSYQERLATNATVQGSAADITMSAQIRIARDPWFKDHNCFMLLQIHDELLVQCPEEYLDEAVEKLVWYMEHPFGDNVKLNLDFPVNYDVGYNYAEAK